MREKKNAKKRERGEKKVKKIKREYEIGVSRFFRVLHSPSLCERFHEKLAILLSFTAFLG
jgi:hypothetical protein